MSGASRFNATAADHFPKGLPSASIDAALMKRIGAEAGDDLVQLIRAESVNPPGNETRAAKVLIELLRREGLEPEFFEPIPDRGNVSVRLRGGTTEIASGEVFSIDRLRNPWSDAVAPVVVATAPADSVVVEAVDSDLRQATDRLNVAFQLAIDNADADAAARAALELDDAIAGWSIDTLQSSDADYARSVLRSMVTRLAGAATGGLRDPREVVGPFVQILLDLRAQVRADKRFDLSDMIRDRFAEINVEVRDTPQGVEWGFRQEG